MDELAEKWHVAAWKRYPDVNFLIYHSGYVPGQAEEVLRSAAGDPIARIRPEYLEHPRPHFQTYGPQTRREFLRLMQRNGGRIS